MSMLLLDETTSERTRPVPLSVDQYHRMLETGILGDGDPIELLDGLLVWKDRGEGMTVNPTHRLIVNQLMQLVPELEGAGCHLQLQAPVTIPPHHEPEPDGMIVRGRNEDYARRHPGPEDVSSVVEVAKSSLQRDRTTKLRIYAAAGIPQYVLINLVDRRVEVYEEPVAGSGSYGESHSLSAGEDIPLLLPDDRRLPVPVSDWLP